MFKIPDTWKGQPGWWMAAGAYLSVIYLTLPVAPVAEKMLFTVVDKQWVLGGISATIILALVAVMAALARAGHWGTLMVLPFVLVGGGVFMAGRNPVEQVHLIEFAGLALMLYQACGRPAGRGLLAPLFLSLLAGCVDEGIQGLLPNRFLDFWDVVIDLSGAAVALWVGPLVMQPVSGSRRVAGEAVV